MWKWFGVGALIAGLLVAGAFIFIQSDKQQAKTGYVITQKLFADFEGTKEADAKLIKEQSKHKTELDSLQLLLQAMIKNNAPKIKTDQLRLTYQSLYEKYARENETSKQQYSGQLWQQINQYINEYGAKEGYTYIYGADGSGALMYADSTNNLTDEVLVYINKKYAGE